MTFNINVFDNLIDKNIKELIYIIERLKYKFRSTICNLSLKKGIIKKWK